MDDSELRNQLEKLHTASFGWAMGCCNRNAPEAEEVLQTVYVKILEGKAQYKGKAAFKTWLFSVIRLTAVDLSRRKMLRHLKLLRFSQAVEPAASRDPEDLASESQLQQKFVVALAELPHRQRQVLELVFYHDFSLSEAAEIMDIFVGSARTHYERGKKKLREWLEASKFYEESQRSKRRQD